MQLLADQAVSQEAKALALAVRPETDYEDVLRLLDQTDGARAMSDPPRRAGLLRREAGAGAAGPGRPWRQPQISRS